MFASSPFPLDAGEVRKPRQRQPSPLRALILLLALPAAIFAGILIYAHETAPTKASLAPAPPSYHGHLVWADGKVIFAHKKEVAAWLRQHGGKYPVFTKRHPVATKLVTPIKRHPAAKPRVTKAQQAAAAAKARARTLVQRRAAARIQAAEHVAVPASSSLWRDFLPLTALAGLLLCFALLPPALLSRAGMARLGHNRQLRFGFAVAATAILAGFTVASLIP